MKTKSKRWNFQETVGLVFNGLEVLSERKAVVNGRERIFCTCICHCENKTIFETRRDGVISGGTTSCGCITKKFMRELGKNSKKYNEYDLSGDFGIGYTSKGEPFYFDLEDYEKIRNECWYYDKDEYVVSHDFKMHRLILGLTDRKVQVDHIMFCNYDNRKSQIRICSNSQNNANKKISKKNTSGIIGVSTESDRDTWRATLKVNGKNLIERFEYFEDCVKQRLIWEKQYFGEFAPQKHLFEKYGVQ